MEFVVKHEGARPSDLDAMERDLGIRMPQALRNVYLESNGGIPVMATFSSQMLDTGIEFLSLEDAARSYRRLVDEVGVLSPNQFPFGSDPGGDYWVVDCDSPNGVVAFLQGVGDDSIVSTELDMADFLASLTAE